MLCLVLLTQHASTELISKSGCSHSAGTVKRIEISLILRNQYSIRLLPYGQDSYSVLQADWLKMFEFNVIMGHYYPVIPAHYVKMQLRIRNTDQCLEHFEQQFGKAANGFCLQWLHARPTIMFAL